MKQPKFLSAALAALLSVVVLGANAQQNIRPDQTAAGIFMIFDEESNLIKSGAIDEYKESYSTLQPGHYIVRYYNEEGFVCAEQIYKAF